MAATVPQAGSGPGLAGSHQLPARPPDGSVDVDAIGVRRFGNGLVEGGAAGPAVSAAAGGDAQGLGAVIEWAAGVARFGADVGLDHAADGAAALVADGD